jgi:hypothetical protein
LSDETQRVLSYLGAMRAPADLSGVQSAGDRYLAIAAPVNEVVAMFNAATDDSFKAQVIQALSIVLDFATTEFESADWPGETQDAVERLVQAANAASAAAVALVSDLTDEAAEAFANAIARLTMASSKMRTALGLPIPTGS